LSARNAPALGRREEAEAALQRGQEAVPGEPRMFSEYARLAEGQGDWIEALRRWELMRERRPTYWQGYAGTAGALRALKRFDEADAVLEEGQVRMADPHAMYLDYPRAAEQRGNWEEALRRWRLAYDRYPHHWLANAGLLGALVALGRLDEAEVWGVQASERFPDNLPIHFIWADCAIRRQKPELAAERYGQAAKHNPTHQVARHKLIDQLLLLDRQAEAEAAIVEALQRWPGDPAFLRYRITLAQRMKRFDVAFTASEAMPGNTPEAMAVKRDLALAILSGQPPEPAASQVLELLATQPDPGDRQWLPTVAHLPENGRALLSWIGALLEKNRFDTDSPALVLLRSISGHSFTDVEILSYMERFVTTGRTFLTARIFSFLYYLTKPGEKERIGAIFETYLANELAKGASAFDPVRFVAHLMFASIFSETAHGMLVGEAHRVVPADDPPPADSCFDDPWDIVRTVAAAFPRSEAAIAAPAVIETRSRPLRVALCVSGQLRGYREAFSSWSSLGLDGHAVTTFVHTWHEVGQNWARLWDFLRERPLWEAVNSLGAGWIRDNYPGLGQAIDAAMASGSTVDEARLREFYGTDFVWVDDDRQAPFAGNVNTWKMHYKMYEAQRRATDSGIDFDLYIKIRPDQLLRSRSAVDWHQLFEESVRRRALYADRGYQFTGEIIKLADQFVTGAREPMDAYMSVFPRFTRCIEAKRFPFDGPQFFRAHAAVGFRPSTRACWYATCRRSNSSSCSIRRSSRRRTSWICCVWISPAAILSISIANSSLKSRPPLVEPASDPPPCNACPRRQGPCRSCGILGILDTNKNRLLQ